MTQSIQHQNTHLWFGNDLCSQLNSILKSDFSDCKKIIITDEHVFDLWVENLISSVEELHHAEIIQLPAGEENKTIEICYQVWESLSDYQIGRQDLILNFGGGVITDMGGFIASTFKRGLKFINIPTTLLSQVDASVGGKTGVDLGPFKNQIGVFSNPEHVLIDYKYLSTLAEVELKSGLAEMLKHGLIRDENHWKNLIGLKALNHKTISAYIFDSVQIKHNIVTTDPKENNERKSLNFGHTIGHAFEGVLLQKETPVPHGFAVGWGMLVESILSYKLNLIGAEELSAIEYFIKDFYPDCSIKLEDLDEVMLLMQNDKKNDASGINFTLLNGIGNFKINQIVEPALIQKTLVDYLKS